MRCEGVCKRANLSLCQGTFESRHSSERGAVGQMSHYFTRKAGILLVDSKKKEKYDFIEVCKHFKTETKQCWERIYHRLRKVWFYATGMGKELKTNCCLNWLQISSVVLTHVLLIKEENGIVMEERLRQNDDTMHDLSALTELLLSFIISDRCMCMCIHVCCNKSYNSSFFP